MLNDCLCILGNRVFTFDTIILFFLQEKDLLVYYLPKSEIVNRKLNKKRPPLVG